MVPLRSSFVAAVALWATASLSAELAAQEGGARPRVDVSGRAKLATKLADAAAARLATLQQEAERPFVARASPLHGAVRSLAGGRLATTTADRGAAALGFLERHGALFGLPPALKATTKLRGERVYVSFTLAELPIVGLEATVLFDAQGRITGANVVAPGPARPLGRFVVGDEVATRTATDALAHGRGRPVGVAAPAWQEPRLQRAWQATGDGLVPVLRVALASVTPGESWEVVVDARDGAQRRVVTHIDRGEGLYPFFGNFIVFDTKSASGTAFKSIDKALDLSASSKSLKNWARGIGAPVNQSQGFLTGAFIDIYDDNNQNVFSSSGNFKTDLFADPDAFDQVNTYYQCDTFFAHLKKQLGHAVASDFSLPFVVNAKSTTPNAFFSSDPFPLDNHVDGFILFFDLEPVLDEFADFSRDPTVVAHEYTHAWIHYEGESFEDDLDYPTRAAGEGLADFFALAWQKDDVIGRYIDAATGIGISRDLQDDDFFIDTLADAVAVSGTPLPEEHRAGEILGSFCTDLREELGTKKAERLVYAALPFMPNSMVEIGYPLVDATNMVDASGDFLLACLAGLLDVSPDAKQTAAIVGFATARGIVGDDQSVGDVTIDLASFSKGKITIPGAFVGGDPAQSFFFTAPPGSTLSVTVKADKNGALPDFTLLRAVGGTPDASTSTQPKKFTSEGRKVSEKGIALLLGQGEVYQLVIENDGFDGGFTLTLDV